MSRTCQLTGKSVMTGNNVSKANNRTRRRFIPNLQQCSLHSEILGMSSQFRIAVSTIRTVEKKGGLDGYLLEKGVVAWNGNTHLYRGKHPIPTYYQNNIAGPALFWAVA